MEGKSVKHEAPGEMICNFLW